MKKLHPKYTLKQGDTIQSISKLFAVKEDSWKRYHNSMCRLDDIIKKRLPSHLKEIYLLPELWEKEMNLNYAIENDEKVSYHAIEGLQNKKAEQRILTDWVVYPRPKNLNHAYWFRHIIEDGKSTSEIRYKILVRYIRQETENTNLYLIHRISDIYVNDELPNLCMDELAYEAGKVFYPMVVELDEKTQWVALRNYRQIKKNWFDTVRPYIGLRFGGDIGLKYISEMDKVMDKEDEVGQILQNNMLLRLYFGTFYQNYSQQFETERVLEFHTGSHSPARFNVKCRLNRNLTHEGYKEVTQAGTSCISDTSAAQDNLSEDKPATYSARILLEADTHSVREAKVEWSMEDTRQKTKLILYPLRQPCKDEFDISIREPLKTQTSALRSFGKMLIYKSKLRFYLNHKP